jgi:hypothetical protein
MVLLGDVATESCADAAIIVDKTKNVVSIFFIR